MKIAVGTDKGLLIYEGDSETWKLKDLHFVGLPIGAFHADVDGVWWVAVNHKHWGSKLYRSSDQGESFKEISRPQFSTDSELSLKSVWIIESQMLSNRKRILIGTEPAAIFYSDDEGESFHEMRGLSEHPSRHLWQGGGKGSKSPFLHTILCHPQNENHLIAGISCAGIFQSVDAGNTWQPTNTGLKAFFLPDGDHQIGHDPHTLRQSQQNPNILWQQNHCGIYRSEDTGETWQEITDANGNTEYGFALVSAAENDNEAWVIPAQSDDMRLPLNQKLEVFYTADGGKTWQSKSKGLPPAPCFDLVLRDAMTIHNELILFGTNNGNLYLSSNKGEEWHILSQNLSTVRCVRFVS